MFVDKDKEKEILALDSEESEEDEWDAYGEELYRRFYPEIVEAVREYIRRSQNGEYDEPEETEMDIGELQNIFFEWYENRRKSREASSGENKSKVKEEDSN